MKKKLIAFIAATGLISSVFAGSQTWTISNGICSNILSAPVKVTAITIQSSTTNTTSVAFIDAPSTVLTNIVGSYSVITLKGTNFINSYTDFWGNATSITNFSLIHETNTVAAQTNTFPTRFNLTSGTNSQSRVDNVSYFFVNGLTVTNNGAGPVTLNLTYQQ